ncbi:MAG: type VI secretion system tube protein Hcp [Syntrophaceae bacterium]
MGLDAFMKIDGIPGESSDAQFKDWIEVVSFNWELDAPSSATSRTGGLRCSAFGVVKVIDKATPLIFKAMTQAERINEIDVAFCRAGKEKVKYLDYVFKNCIITKVTFGTTGESGQNLPVEHVHFRFATVEITYYQQKRDTGSSAGQIVQQWSPSNWS